MDLYIYYQVPAANAAALQPAVRAMQARLAAGHGVAGQLKFRPQTKDGLQTWMEVYPATPPAFREALDAAVAQAGLPDAIAGPRHVEIFTDDVPCA
jgi:hypothetical protein